MTLGRIELNHVKGVVSSSGHGAGPRGEAVIAPSVQQVTFASVTQTQASFVA
jgi:hypothetical protein